MYLLSTFLPLSQTFCFFCLSRYLFAAHKKDEKKSAPKNVFPS